MGIFIFLVLGSLAAFRVSELLVIDDGPWEIFSTFRGFLYRKAMASSSKTFRSFYQLFTCVHCMGFWLCVPILALYYYHNFYLDAVILFFALAGLQSIFANKLGRS